MVRDEIIEKLRTLDVFPDTLENPNSTRENAEIFERCNTLDDIAKEARSRHWTCGSGQFIYFHLGSLLKREPKYRSKFLEEARQRFSNSGINPNHIEEYFQSGGDPGCVFTLRYEGRYNKDTRLNFYRQADQFVLDKMKEWLEIR